MASSLWSIWQLIQFLNKYIIIILIYINIFEYFKISDSKVPSTFMINNTY